MSTPEAPAPPPGRNESRADDGLARLMELTGDIAVLPAGSRLTDENRSGHQCFVLLDGAATVEQDGTAVRGLKSGAFVGDVSPDGPAGGPDGTASWPGPAGGPDGTASWPGGPAGWADGPAVRPDGPALWLGSHGGWREGLDPAAPEPARAG